jgi:hypothetical protein
MLLWPSAAPGAAGRTVAVAVAVAVAKESGAAAGAFWTDEI